MATRACSTSPSTWSMTIVLLPSHRPVASYQRGRGISTASTFEGGSTS